MNKITLILGTLLVLSCSNPSDLDKIQDINSTFENTPVEIKGVVTGVFQDKAALSGFFIQDDALFASSKIITSLYNNRFEGELNKDFCNKIFLKRYLLEK